MSEPADKTTQAMQSGETKRTDSLPYASSSSQQLEPGTRLNDRYLIEAELGRGGIGVVFLARDLKLHNTQVVIKVLLDDVRDSEHREWFERHFRQEAEAMARIDHPGVVRLLDQGELPDGRVWLVMQYVAGVGLHKLIKPAGMELARVAHLVRQLGQALTAAHQQGVFHRDLKPENLMIQQTGGEEYLKVIDFGIATVHEKRMADPSYIKTTQIAGTFAYMAPEQFDGKPGASSDIYAMGVIAYEMVTGRRPFNFDSYGQLRELQRMGVRVNPSDLRPSLPLAAQALILKALSYSKYDRPASAKEFGEQLAEALTAENSEAPTARLELAHVLFMDLVGYSKMPINEQERTLQLLQQVVSNSDEFIRAQRTKQLLRLPTGDGMALVFFGDPVAPSQCAVEIASTLREQPDIKLRMGIHTGPVRRLADINQNLNVSGGGINVAQRVMDCGDAGHILVSKTVADTLSQLSEWQPALHDLGEHIVKHGERLHLFNLYTEEAGNPEPTAKTRQNISVLDEQKKKEKSVFNLVMNGPISCQMQIVLALALCLTPGLWVVWIEKRAHDPTSAISQPYKPQPISLAYWLTAQRNPKLYPGSQPFVLPSETVLGPGDRVRLHVNNAQPGYLYVINEGPQPINGLPAYVILFPYATMSGVMEAGQTIQIPQPSQTPNRDWFVLDQEEGAERIWLVWSAHALPEMEAVKSLVNAKDQGEIREAAQINAVQQFLTKHAAQALRIEKDEVKQQTRLTGKGDVLVKMLKLEHR